MHCPFRLSNILVYRLPKPTGRRGSLFCCLIMSNLWLRVCHVMHAQWCSLFKPYRDLKSTFSSRGSYISVEFAVFFSSVYFSFGRWYVLYYFDDCQYKGANIWLHFTCLMYALGTFKFSWISGNSQVDTVICYWIGSS
ncbi:hypothetical protein SAY86_020992 [Trapa natans]|uniref:Uncharacterized protein n=1 Tax=Trapa natans TaxID=22666 RepID=A0AAN7M769_TRANT|nr:hypothetical protein SAY86_020992 [Trapa natans]